MPNPSSVPHGRSFGRSVKLAAGFALSAILLWATLRAVPLDRVASALAGARPAWIAAAVGFVALSYSLKIYRWVTMLRSLGSAVRPGEAAVPFLAGVAFNNLLPFRSGDVMRVVAFQRVTGVATSAQLGTLVLERLLDLLVLMCILFATVGVYQSEALDQVLLHGLKLAALAVAVSILIFIAAPRWLRLIVQSIERRLPRLRHAGEALLRLSDAVATLSSPSLIVRLVGLSFLAWFAEGGAFLAVGLALGVAATPEAALLALSVGTLSTIIPSSPGYVGTFHYFTARVASGVGAGGVGSAAYAILIHAVLWLPTTATGLLLLTASGLGASRGASSKSVSTEEAVLDERV